MIAKIATTDLLLGTNNHYSTMTDNPAMGIGTSNFKGKEHYKLCPKKLREAPMGLLPYVLCSFGLKFSEDYEYFHLIKPYLDIPEKPKTIDEILEGLDNKIDNIVDSYRRASKYRREKSEKAFDETFRRIDSRFKYAKEHNEFSPIVSLSLLQEVLQGSNWVASNTAHWNNPFGKDPSSAGHYQIAPNMFIPKAKKPNWLHRFSTQKLLGWHWVDQDYK